MRFRLAVLLVLLILLGTIAPSQRAGVPDAAEELYLQFRDPPRQFGLMPYWYWNGRITPEESRRQIRSMTEQGVYSAIVFPWDGMELPYLGEPWWEALGSALDAAAEAGFTLNLNDDFTWPSSHAWDHYQQDAELSTVVRENPDYRMKSLVSVEHVIKGPTEWERSFSEKPEVIVVGRLGADLEPDPGSLQQLTLLGDSVQWDVPSGKWKALVYTVRPVTGAHNTRIDLLNPDAVAKYIQVFYEELARRFPQHLGRTLKLTTADHEGTYGVHPVWTPGLWTRFRERHGYDLRPLLPLLRSARPGRAVKVRSDYFDLVSEMYRESFVEQVTSFCEGRGIRHAASFYEEQLAIQIKQAGDMLGIWRTTSDVEVDALLERARMPVDFKEAVSVAHFEGKRLLVENQGLQGHDSLLSPEKMRLGTNMALLWGANRLVPYFDYDRTKVQWPPQWFEGQPYWRYFRQYADYVSRATYMNSRGRHVAPVAVYYPLESAWAGGRHLFDSTHRRELQWGNSMDDTQAWYTALQLELARSGWDYHIVDAHYLQQASLEKSTLRIGDEAFKVLILPPLSSIRREAMQKIRAFVDRGGTVIALLQLPDASPEAGDQDPEITDSVQDVFGREAGKGEATVHKSPAGGTAYFFPCGRYGNFMNVLNYMVQTEVPLEYRSDLSPMLEILSHHLRQEAEVVKGEATGIYVSHRYEDTTHFYWVVNDTERARQTTLLLSPTGTVQQWDPLTGRRSALPSRMTDRGTEVELKLEPWGATFVVVGKALAQLPQPRAWKTIHETDLTGKRWIFTPESPEIAVPYARVRVGEDGEGQSVGWSEPSLDTSAWTEEWLSVERLANPSWWAIGPFPYGDHTGYNQVFPPENDVDLDAGYPGQRGAQLGWSYVTAESYWVNLRELLKMSSQSVAYAFSHVYSPIEQQAQVRVAFADSVKLWWNGEEKLAVHRHPKWMLLRDPWSESVPVRLQQGWNRVLIKVCRSENRPISFLFRISDSSGDTLKKIVYSKSADAALIPKKLEGEKWYRVTAPPGTRSVQVPGFEDLRRIYIDGRPVPGRPGGQLKAMPGAVISFVCGAGEQLERPIRFTSGATEFAPGSWSGTSLANYSGLATYETEFSIAAMQKGRRVELDLGMVGLTAEVWLNDERVGARIWRPHTFDLTRLVRPGANRLRIAVANSDANWQSQGDVIYPAGSWGLKFKTERDRLKKIEPNGLIGPITLRVQQ